MPRAKNRPHAEKTMDIIKIISELGFPVAICLILIFQVNGKIDRILIDTKEIKSKIGLV